MSPWPKPPTPPTIRAFWSPCIPAPPNKETWLPGVSALIQTGQYNTFLSAGQTYNQSATVVDEVEKSFGIDIKVASVGALGQTF